MTRNDRLKIAGLPKAACLSALLVAALVGGCANKTTEAGSPSLLGSNGDGYGSGKGYGRGAPGSPEDFKSTGRDTVYFSSDSSDLTPEAQQIVTDQSRWLQQYSQHTVTIEGHADERGTREYNIALGARRAQSLRTALVSKGVNAARIRTISYGKERPVAVCDDISCWSQNRRAQTTLGGAAVSQR
jgi:peptidoglycan-associated lipoprotein